MLPLRQTVEVSFITQTYSDYSFLIESALAKLGAELDLDSPIWIFRSLGSDFLSSSIHCNCQMLKRVMLSCWNALTVLRIILILNILYSPILFPKGASFPESNFEGTNVFSTFVETKERSLYVEEEALFAKNPMTHYCITCFPLHCSSACEGVQEGMNQILAMRISWFLLIFASLVYELQW